MGGVFPENYPRNSGHTKHPKTVSSQLSTTMLQQICHQRNRPKKLLEDSYAQISLEETCTRIREMPERCRKLAESPKLGLIKSSVRYLPSSMSLSIVICMREYIAHGARS